MLRAFSITKGMLHWKTSMKFGLRGTASTRLRHWAGQLAGGKDASVRRPDAPTLRRSDPSRPESKSPRISEGEAESS